MRMKKGKRVVAAVLVPLFLASCSASTMIQTEPTGATVYVDGLKMGKTPYRLSDSKIVMAETGIKLEKAGYSTLETTIAKDETVNIGPAIAGFFLVVPWLWALKYDPAHNYTLEPGNGRGVDRETRKSIPKTVEKTIDETVPKDLPEPVLQPSGQGAQNGSQPGGKGQGDAMGKSKADRLRELKKLQDDGIITSAEFEKEKKKILDE